MATGALIAISMRRLVACCCIAASLIVGFAAVASAHPSDPETLTVDLLLGPEGLEVIDVAVVAGVDYEPFPTVEQRRAIADQIMAALGIDEATTNVDSEMGERYHEVGFTIRLKQPFSDTKRKALRTGTAPLQQIARSAGAKWLKLEACDRSAPDPFAESPSGTTKKSGGSFVVRTDADRPGRPSNIWMNERQACRVWRLKTDGPAFTLTARLTPSSSATSGVNLLVVGMAVLIAAGIAICFWALRRRK
jgi:hypothetical protein